MDIIEPTAVIGPDGTVRTGWERPDPFPYEFTGPSKLYSHLSAYSMYGAMARKPFTFTTTITGL